MKVIFVTREGYNQPGARIRSYGFAKELNKRDISTRVLSFVDSLGGKAGIEEGGFSLEEKVRLIFRGIRELILEKGIFVINRFNYHALSPWFSALVRKNPYVFDMDDWEAREDIGYRLGFIPKSRAEALTRIISARSRFCMASSHYLKDYLSQFNKRVYYIPTGVDLEISKGHNLMRDKIIFSWHGTINRREVLNYIEFVFACFLSLRQKYNFIELWIKGAGTFIKELVILIKRYNNYGDIKFYSWSPPWSIPSYLDKVDIGLIPLLDKSRFNLAKCPTKILEYMARGKPVIASALGEASHIIRHGYNSLLASSKDEFIYYMEKLIKDRLFRDTLGENACICVRENYSLNILGEKLYKIFLENFK
jgi:glycosyltransferase involved in cell wall biosynthesis